MRAIYSNAARLLAVLAAVGMVVAATVGATQTEGEDITVTAVFADGSPLVVGNDVRAAGVVVGEISAIVLRQGRAHVEMLVEDSVLPLHRDAKAVITTQDLLGERYVTLERGTPSEPTLEDPPVILESNTERVVELQDVLNAVDDPTGASLAALVTTLGEGMDMRGPEIAAAIRALQPAMRQTDELGGVLAEQNELLAQLVGNAQPVADAVGADRGAKLDRLVGVTEQTLGAVAADRQAVQESLDRLPGTLAKARSTLSKVAGVSEATTPTLAAMRPITDDLTDVSAELHRFADAADPALASLPAVLERADTMLGEARPLVQALRPAGPELVGLTDSYRPLAEQALSTHLTDFMEFVKGWSLSTSGYDHLGHYFRASVPATPRANGTLVAGPIPGAENPTPDLPVPEVPLVPLPGPGEDPLAGLIPGNPGAAAAEEGAKEAEKVPRPNGSATGLTAEQENQMLGQLLGGL